jgi:tetratricopeptide (TPR) repeat protein
MLKVLVGLLLYISTIVVLKSDIIRVSFEDLCSESSLKSDSYIYKVSQLQDPERFNIQTDGITFGRNVSANVLANVVYGCGQFHSASSTFASKQLSARFYELSIKLDPALLEGYLNLGYMYDQIGDEYNSHLIYFKCMDAYIQVVSHLADPDYRLSRDLVAAECIANIVNKEIWNEFGVKSVRHVRAAMRLIAFSLVELNPSSHGSYNQLGLILTNQGNYNGAHKFFQKSLKLNPTNYIAWLNTGNHFFRLNKFSKAVEAFKSTIFVSSIEDKLGSVFVINNMGQSFREMGLLQEALNSFSVAIVLLFNGKHEVFKTLNDETFHLNINSTWRDIDVNVAKFIVSAAASDSKKGGGFIDRDIRGYSLTDMIKDSVVKLTFPYSNQPIVMLMRSLLWSLSNALAVQGLSCLWNQLEFLEEMLILSVNLNFQYFNEQRVNTLVDPYTVSLLRFSPPDFDLKVSLMSCLYSPQFVFSSQKYRDHLSFGGVADSLTSQKKLTIKIGFISYDWRDHPMGRLTFHLVTKPYLQTNDRFEYEVYCITYSGNDGSPVYAYVNTHCQNFLDFRDAESHIIIDRIKSLELDVLVDLTVHTYRGRVDIPAAKPAPLVVNYLGYAGSSG